MRLQAKTTVLAVATLGFVCAGTAFRNAHPAHLLVVEHVPGQVARRAGDLTANVCGRYRGVEPLRYRVNDGTWRALDVRRVQSPRLPDDRFTIELDRDDLVAGANTLELVGDGDRRVHRFRYSDAPVALPARADWRVAELDVQDGHWERYEAPRGWTVRPVPGTEGYDRILGVTGAFTGPRRVECEVTLREVTHEGRLFGFGVLPLWGGHREDDNDVLPRRGWRYGIAWYYSKQGGVGVETSDKLGAADYTAATAYETAAVEPGVTYRVVTEAVPAGDGWRLRLKWWPVGEAEPAHWIELHESGARTPASAEYAVALVAHRCQAEFGAVSVTIP